MAKGLYQLPHVPPTPISNIDCSSSPMTTTVDGRLVVKGELTFTPGGTKIIDLNILIEILFCPIKDLSLYLLSENEQVRYNAQKRYEQFNSDLEEFKKAMEK